MSKIANMVSDYILECVKLGVDKNVGICNRAKNRIKEIDLEIARTDALREERHGLRGILMQLGDPDYVKTVNEDEVIKIDDKSPEISDLKKQICKILESGPLTNREVMNRLMSEPEGKVIRVLKLLGQDDVIKRDGTPENKIVHGEKWEAR